PQLVREGDLPFRSPDSHPGSRLRRRTLLTTVGAIAVAAAAVAIVLGIGLVRADNRVSNLQSAQAAPLAAVAGALATPGHRVIPLDAGRPGQQAQVVVTPAGQGYLVSS